MVEKEKFGNRIEQPSSKERKGESKHSFTLVIPEKVYQRLEEVSKERGISVASVIKGFCRLELYLYERGDFERTPGVKTTRVQVEGKEIEIIF